MILYSNPKFQKLKVDDHKDENQNADAGQLTDLHMSDLSLVEEGPAGNFEIVSTHPMKTFEVIEEVEADAENMTSKEGDQQI